jgi:hypothetical protein
MNFVQLQADLAKHFPKVWIKEGSLFSNNHCESLWTGEGSMIELFLANGESLGEVEAFDMYPVFESLYVFGVHKNLHAFLQERGYYAEAHDGGTYFIWQA